MTAITLDQADRLIDAILARGAALDCRPLSVIVVEPGCKVKAFKKEDGASMIRFEMAYGKAYAALAMGRSSKLVQVRAEEKPIFMRYLLSASGDQIFPEGGGMQIRARDGAVIGAVGVTGDTEERDEELAAYGIRVARLQPTLLEKRMSRTRCHACHAESNNAFRMERLSPGAAFWSDEQSRRNLEMASRLVNPGDPASSRLLQQPLAPEAGGNVFHSG